jgi:hypothetical protein
MATDNGPLQRSVLSPQYQVFIETKYCIIQIPPSYTLNNWYPCFDDFLCAVLDVRLSYSYNIIYNTDLKLY